MTPVLFTIGSRANYGSCLAVIREWSKRGHPFRVLCYASAVDRLYGDVAFDAEREFPGHVTRGKGLVPGSAQLTASLALMQELGEEPVVYVVGDRYETLAVSYAARLAGKLICHQMGGERSGNIDDVIRDANTVLAHVHFVATDDALLALQQWVCLFAYNTGCPRIDLALAVKPASERMIMVMLHPGEGDDFGKYRDVIEAANRCGEVDVWWPNCDPGSEKIVEMLRSLGVRRTHRNMHPDQFYRYLKSAKLIVGNSSVIVREASALGVPGVVIGKRQDGRPLLGALHCDGGDFEVFAWAMHSERPKSAVYGDGKAAGRICDRMEELA